MGNSKGNKISIVVLPFKNISNNPEMDFFSDGISEEIIFALAKVEQLKVISRTSSFYYKDHQASTKEIGAQLDVSVILEGSVRVSGNLLRVTAQLIQVEEDAYLWSETWDRKLDNLFEIQDEISLLIADKLREHLGHLDISDHLVENPTSDLNAYKHYLKGRHHFKNWNPEEINLAIKEFELAASLDNNMIEAQLGIADAYSFMAVAGFAPRESAWAKVQEAMERAKEIDEDDPILNYMLANQAFFTNADFSTARKLIFKSLAKAPTNPESQLFASFLFTLNGEFKKAKEHVFYAKSIDPLNPETLFYEANYYYRTGAYEQSSTILKGLLEQNDKSLPAIIVSLYIKIKNQNWEAAQEQLEQIPEEMFTPDERLGLLCLIEITKGNNSPKELAELIENAKEKSAQHAHTYLFVAYSMLKKYEEAYETLNNLFDHKSPILLLSFSDPLSENIRSTSAYQNYHKKIYPPIIAAQPPKPKKTKEIDDLTIQKDLTKLNNYMDSEKPFLNPALSLRLLANSVGIHPNQLSWLLNQSIGKNFNEFINQKRIAHFKKLVVDPSNSHISLIGLAYESGFNSKTVFNTAFKKEVGMTPKAYQKANMK